MKGNASQASRGWIPWALLFLAIWAPTVAEGAGQEWIVSAVCGDDTTGDGSRARPLASIEAALRRAADSGDVIRVLPSGDLSNACPPLTGYPNTRISKDVCLVAEAGPLETRSEGFVIDPDRIVTIRGFTITNAGGHGIDITQGAASGGNELTTVENCVIDACGQDGIRIDNRSADTHFRLWVKNCSILNSTGAGIQFILGCSQFCQGAPPTATIENCIIKDNMVEGVRSNNSENVGEGTITIRYCYIGGNNSGGGQIDLANNRNVVIDQDLPNVPIFRNEPMCDYRLDEASTLRHKGNPNCTYLNPDGTRNDPGAFGGPGSLGFSPQTGPVILSIQVGEVRDGKVQVRVVTKER